VHDGELVPEAVVQIPLRMMNRHAWWPELPAPGRRYLQTIAEKLSSAGVAVFAADVKGDVSGAAVAGDPGGQEGALSTHGLRRVPSRRRLAHPSTPRPQALPLFARSESRPFTRALPMLRWP
jgi:Helicase HerA-like C-terminal